MWRIGLLAVCACCACTFNLPEALSDGAIDAIPDAPRDAPLDGPGRVRAGLTAFYNFDEGTGVTVRDTAGTASPVDLTIADANKVTWGDGKLTINMPVAIASPKSVQSPISIRSKMTDAVTVEAWVVPELASQTGKTGEFARVVTMSLNSVGRNFAIGQQATQWAAQARTSNVAVTTQGSPILVAPTTVVVTETQLVLTSDGSGRKLYVNGQLAISDVLGGNFDNWLDGYRLSLGGEPTTNNPWKGTILLVAIYDRVLSDAEIGVNFEQGPTAP